jgi:uncharacterized integral membrane protein
MSETKNLQDAIMQNIMNTAQQRKAGKRKEKAILFIYIGTIFFVLLVLFFVKNPQAASPKFEAGSVDLIVYYRMFTVILVASLIAFVLYFANSRSDFFFQK